MKDEKEILPRDELKENIVLAWVQLSAILKNNRITSGLAYNEAVVMLLLYHEYKKTKQAFLPLSKIIGETKMLKSLANRTISSLEAKGLVVKEASASDKRTVLVRALPNSAPQFLQVHRHSLELADEICNIIGEEDALAFIRIAQKISANPPRETP